jgi:hypothetical protein
MITTKYYTIFDKQTGEVLQSGSGTVEMFNYVVDNLKSTEDYIEELADSQFDLIDTITKTVQKNARPQPQKTYQEARQEIYPSVGEQLDMLWHAMDQNQIAKAEPFYSTVKAVKMAVPKDGSVPAGTTVILHDMGPI